MWPRCLPKTIAHITPLGGLLPKGLLFKEMPKAYSPMALIFAK